MQSTAQPVTTTIKYLQVIFFTAVVLYFGKTLFVPLCFGLLIAMMMYPICLWFEKHKWSKSLSIAACLLIVTIVIAALGALLVWQIYVFKKDAPDILNRLQILVQQIERWMIENVGLEENTHDTWKGKIIGNIGNILSSIFRTTANTFFILFLTPVYTTLFLYHRTVFVQYLKLVTPTKNLQDLNNILQQTISTYFNYVKGIMLVYLIVGILNSIGLAVLGVNNALLFGMLCAFMTIIPYIGIFVSALLPISVVWVETNNIWYPIGVIAVFSIVQYLEANVIFPKVVGTQLHVSTLAMLVAVIAGGIIWGVAGMVLFIPFVAIFKIVSDHIKEWKPINILLSRG
jgi:predicted PurR-regulated permease PerM